MMRPKEVERAEVWRDAHRVGVLTRTLHGSRFDYDEAFLARDMERQRGIALHLPSSQARTETFGVNLHPFFAGLLPEGLRLRALLHSVKTSEDDLFSLLVGVGDDTVGDLSVVPWGQVPRAEGEGAKAWKFEQVLFSELFAQSLSRMGGALPEPVVPGVQEKISASTLAFPLGVSGRRAFLLKLNPSDKPRLVENEHFFMRMATACGLSTAPTRLVHDREGHSGLLVERFDRVWSSEDKRLRRIHQEDACQFLNRYPADKYRIPCSDIAQGLADFCVAPLPETLRLLRLVAFSYLVSNGDLHAKNVSLLADGPSGGLRLSPAYDLLSSLPYGDRRMALKFEGRDDNLRRSHFVAFGQRFGVRESATRRMLDELLDHALPWSERLEEIGLEPRKTEHLRRVMGKRREELGAGPVIPRR